jgi:hypothetical protein
VATTPNRRRDVLPGRDYNLNHPIIDEIAFHRVGDGPWRPYGDLDDMSALEREMVRQELRDLGREDDDLDY